VSAERDMTRIVRSWLRRDQHDSAARVLESVLAQLDTTPQRRPRWPVWRIVDMSTFAKLAAVAVLAVAVGFIGYQLLPSTGANVGRPAASASPSPSPSPSPTPSASATSAVPAFGGPLEPGTRYAVPGDTATLTFAVPSEGWEAAAGGRWFDRYGAGGKVAELSFYGGAGASTPGIFTDPCAHTGLRQFEDSVLGHAQAVAALKGVEVVDQPTEYRIDSYRAVMVAVTVPSDPGCANTEYWLGYDPACGVKVECTEYPTWLGSELRYWFVELGDGRFQIRAESRHGTPDQELRQEIQQIVDSIRFERS
jgi:hypothetical protein